MDGTMLGIAHDITEHKRFEEALRESEENFLRNFHGGAGGFSVRPSMASSSAPIPLLRECWVTIPQSSSSDRQDGRMADGGRYADPMQRST